MYEKEEEKLSEYKRKLDDQEVPDIELNQAILTGFQRAKVERRKKRPIGKWLLTAAMVAVILISFITSIRVSPVFASYVANIPGMEKIVDLIRFDKGKMMAIDNDYYEEIGVSEQKDGVEVVIDGAIADEEGLVLFYTINTEEKKRDVMVQYAEISSQDGSELDLGTSNYGAAISEGEHAHSFHGALEFFFQTPLNTKAFILDLEVEGEAFNIPFTLKKEIKENKTYELNETVTVEGQEITFLDVTINPLRVAVHVKMSPDNTKAILSFDDIRLVDEQGEAWSKIENGVTASGMTDNEWIIYLQSNYFKEPDELYLELDKIQAIDKEERMVVVDVENEVILKQPKGDLLTEVKREGNHLVFMYHEEEFHYFLFNQAFDADGEVLSSGSAFSTEEDGIRRDGYHIENLSEQKSPVSLELTFFPKWIVGDEKIRIK